MCINRAPTKLIINNVNEAAASAPSRLSGGATTEVRETEKDVDSGKSIYDIFFQLHSTAHHTKSIAVIGINSPFHIDLHTERKYAR